MKKKIVIVGIVLLLLVGVGIGCYFIGKKDSNKEETKTEEKKKETITITFNTDGGTDVENLTIEKGSEVTLPTTVKDGYNFLGWFDKDDNEVTDKTDFTTDTTLTAKWEEIKKDAKKMKVSFDTNGGNKINSVTMECGKPLSLPSNPTKKGYKFVNWTDKKGNKVSKGATLTCADVTLYAKWEKEEEKPVETKVTYECPSDYELKDTKCIKTVAAKTRCEGTRVYEYEGKCVTVTNTARQDTKKTCPKEHVTYMSFAGEVEGKVVNWGVTGCAYYKTPDTSKDTCESHGFKWVTPENACYVKWISNNTINTCNHLSNYVYLTNPNQFDGVNGLNGGCFPVKEKVKYCESGFKLEGSNCTQTIDATKK